MMGRGFRVEYVKPLSNAYGSLAVTAIVVIEAFATVNTVILQRNLAAGERRILAAVLPVETLF